MRRILHLLGTAVLCFGSMSLKLVAQTDGSASASGEFIEYARLLPQHIDHFFFAQLLDGHLRIQNIQRFAANQQKLRPPE